jgi:hypothetical protein
MVSQKAYVTAAIFASVAFLEASINELFTDAAELKSGELAGTFFERLDPSLTELIADLWKRELLNDSTLKKFDTVLTLARKKPLKGTALERDTNLVIVLRNA